MGVRGLTTYIHNIYNNEKAVLEQFTLRNSQLVIDGHNICTRLLNNNRHCTFGGEYDNYAIHVQNFFENLRKCNITPYVLFDGSHERKKLPKIFLKLETKIKNASIFYPCSSKKNFEPLPLLFRDVFIQVMKEMDVPYTVCEFEVDHEIAAMAKYLNCPVLSNDSDFFIYNVLFIPYNTLQPKPHALEENGSTVYALECKIYKIENFTQHCRLNKEVMPLLAILLGNDFVDNSIFDTFFLQLMGNTNIQLNGQRLICETLNWLQTENLESASTKILKTIKKNKEKEVIATIKENVALYTIEDQFECKSLKYFDIKIGKTIIQPGVSQKSTCIEKDNEPLGMPTWFADYIRQNRVPKCYINLYTLHLQVYSPQLEDYSDRDSCLCALPLIEYVFGILTDFAVNKFTYFSRENNKCTKLSIETDYSILKPVEKPFKELSKYELFSYFNEFVKIKMPGLNLSDLELLPPNFIIFMISVLWWVKNCNVKLHHVHSLFICYVMLEVIDEKIGMVRNYSDFNKKYGMRIKELGKRPSNVWNGTEIEPFLQKDRVLDDDCIVAANVLLSHFQFNKLQNKNSYDKQRMHSFAQFQCSLMHFNSLNVLCSERYPSTRYSKCFNGTFVYNVASKLEDKYDPENFIRYYLKSANNTVFMFYKSLCNIYNRCVDKMGLRTINTNVRQHIRKRKNEVNMGWGFGNKRRKY